MSPLGERLIEFLRSQPDAAEVRDESTANARGQPEAEGIECRYRGADYRVTVHQGARKEQEAMVWQSTRLT